MPDGSASSPPSQSDASPPRRRPVAAHPRAAALVLALALALLLPHGSPGLAQDAAPEQLAFDAALRALDSRLFQRAADEFSAFASKFPGSPLRPAADEQARLARGEAALAAGQWKPAAEAFAAFLRDFPASTNRPRASLREAVALLRDGQAAAARDRIGRDGSPFRSALASSNITPQLAFEGHLLLAEARSMAMEHPAALAALDDALPFATDADQQWRRERLRHDVALAGKLPAQRVLAAEALLALSANSTNTVRKAEANALAARALDDSGQAPRAEPLWERNTSPDVPQPLQREAILRIAQSLLQRADLPAARARLDRFLAGRQADPAWHPVRVLLGQVLFRQYAAARSSTSKSTPEVAGLPAVILAQLDSILTNQPPADLAGPIQYLRGWCLWEEGLGQPLRLIEADAAFRKAAEFLPPSPEQATARFKLGDAALLRGDAAAALAQFLAVADGYTHDPVVSRELRPLAWQQAIAAAIASTNGPAASRAMERLLETHPDAEVSGRSALLVGQSLVQQGNAASGRDLLSRFAQRFPDAPVTADVRLVLASAFIAERQWTPALRELDGWVARYTNHPSLPQAEYDRAYASAEAGLSTNAVEQFRALAQRFATNPLAQTAQLWLGSHFYNLGDFAQSELAYVGVLTNSLWKGSVAAQRARLLASQAAMARGSTTNAVQYLLDLLNDPATPEPERASGYFYLGEARLSANPGSTNGPLSSFSDALEAFAGAARFTNQPVVVAAWGRMAYCQLQLAAQSPVAASRAIELYQRILDSPLSDVSSRAKALVGIGTAYERMASSKGPADAADLLERALKHYLDVVLGSGFLRPGESVPARLLEEAGLAAGQLLEERRRFLEADGLYDRLARELPSLKPVWDARRQRAQRMAQPAP